MISAKNLSYQAGGKRILHDVSFDAHQGELLVILGNNGAGKSTLLKAVCGELRTGGEVLYEGRPIRDTGLNEMARRRAVLRQHTPVNLPFLVREIVMMGRYPHFKNRESLNDHHLVDMALEQVGMSHLASENYLNLSGGEQQRVQLARVLAQVAEKEAGEAQYLFLDEPVSSLDIAQQHNTLRIARGFARKGNSVIAVLHDLNLAAMYADRVLMLKQGGIAAMGTASEVLTPSHISATFGFPAYVQEHPHADCLLVCFGSPENEPETRAGSVTKAAAI